MNFSLSSEADDIRLRAESFFSQEVLPRHREWVQTVCHERKPAPFIKEIQDKAKEEGLWNLALPQLADDEPGTRLTNLEFAPIAEILGRLPWGSQVFNCHAPEVPNMAMLQDIATPEQKEKWLRPLLNAETRSSFAMTEPDVASSDATNIATKIHEEGDELVLNGRKWFATGGAHPDCSFLIVMGISDPDAGRTGQHSMVIVPIGTPGLTLVRKLRFMGWEDFVAPIGEFELKNVRVPKANLLGERGQGFKGAQVRLGPARIHHSMRCVGMAEMVLAQMVARAHERKTFGRPIIEYDTVQKWIAEARIDIDLNRLFIQKAAWLLDTSPDKNTWRIVSQVKVSVPRMLQKVTDRAVQLFGAMGGTDDTLIHHAHSYARWFRIGDGPDEVHLRQIFKTEPVPEWSIADCPYIAPDGF
ncbi:acyl-CoA dehydrogenase family protein [Sneathiella sp. HT1-7]|uniref:acyl-CoA dehydrogenase family protein n=1 Tax=Sneathiella sp. HT1-7 TaxID=2887192 RepID=UPI001D14CF50|nr:acyl-CoA dehydrogenase family protein [Sneathiella sp. HT1-7]MCC3305295.1 acyl-CoA dehydrogenase family protein [Sneathiella sp. HT1-7]